MRIVSVNYIQWEQTPREWKVEGLQLGPTNLLVGTNATGKSKVVRILAGLAILLSGERKMALLSGSYDVTFDHEEKIFRYELGIKDSKIIRENLSIDGEARLERGEGGQGRLWAEKVGQFMDFQIPDTELTVLARRDPIQHSFFQPLNDWGKSMYQYHFSTLMGKDRLGVIDARKPAAGVLDPRDPNQIIGIYRKGQQVFGEKFKDAIKRDMGEVGYLIDDVGTQRPISVIPQNQATVIALYVKETGLGEITDQVEMSQGMFRALAMLIQLNFSEMTQRAGWVLVDDVGEGLDFERSCNLTKLLMKKAEASSKQLIMTTNDRFLMNATPAESWTVLRRVGQTLKVHNYENSKARFEELRSTGMNAPDFFSSTVSEESKEEK